MRSLIHFAVGLLFGTGILVSGMANPAKVLNFFDIFGSWDPSLLLVMGSAMIVTLIGYQVMFRRGKPFLAGAFMLPHRREIDLQLVGGSALFGIGWGISGFCPGGAIPGIGLMRPEPVIFVAALCAGILLARLIRNVVAASSPVKPARTG